MRGSALHETLSDAQLDLEVAMMNNFVAFLPGGMYRDSVDLVMKPGQTYGEYFPLDEKQGRSQLLLSQTPADFFALIDAIIIRHGINLVDVNVKKADHQKKMAIKKLIAPVYKELRKMGYTDFELNQ